jgi:putative tRNA adenosine deaminase-associated protein
LLSQSLWSSSDLRKTALQWHDVAVSYFTAVLARHGRGWRVLDLDVDDAEDLDGLADLVRGSLPGAGPGLAIIEREDSWFALVRVDDDGEPRPFVSDLRESLRSRYAVVLESAADVDIPQELDGLADAVAVDDEDDEGDENDAAASGSTSDDEVDDEIADDEEAEPDDVLAVAREALTPDLTDLEPNGHRPSRTWAGDPALLEDLGFSAAELVRLTIEESDDPGAALAGIGEACGFDEALDALR